MPPTLLTLGRTDTAWRSRPGDRSRITSPIVQLGNIFWRVRLDGEAPGLGALAGNLDWKLALKGHVTRSARFQVHDTGVLRHILTKVGVAS
jgi:hypothetical protein